MSNSTHENICIITSSSSGIGRLFIESLINEANGISFYYYNPIGTIETNKYAKLLLSILSKIKIYQILKLSYYFKLRLRQDISNIEALEKKHKITSYWITLSSPELISISNELIKSNKIVRVTIWDAPEYLCQSLKLSSSFKKIIINFFSNSIQNAKSISVIGENMRYNYLNQYKKKSIILRHAIDQQKITSSTKKNKIRIAFCGSLYSKKEWNSFISALEKNNWYINDKKVYLYFIGGFPRTGAIKGKNLILLNSRTFKESIKILQQMQIGYLPYWFSEDFHTVASTSFPGKLSAYAAAGNAIFNHAPNYTETFKFLNKYKFGITCSSLQAEDIINSLSVLDQYTTTNYCINAREKAIKEELSTEVMLKRFQDFLS